MPFLLEKCSSLRCDSPSTPGSNFGVEMHKTWADGKPLHGTDGKAPKIKVPMENAESRLGPRKKKRFPANTVECFNIADTAFCSVGMDSITGSVMDKSWLG